MDFDEIKKKAAETAEVIADKSAEAAKVVAEKAKIFAAKAKLMAEIAGEKDDLRRGYQDLGKLYFEKYGDAPAEDLAQAVEAVKISAEKIESKTAELDALKNSDAEPETDECCCEDEECCCCEDEECCCEEALAEESSEE